MKKVRRLVSAIAIAAMAMQMIPASVVAAELNTIAPPEAFGPVPNESQLKYHEEELAAFIHFGMNTFTNSEWGNGSENPNSFNPTDLDPEQWVKALKDAGFKRLIMVGKHHDGFVIWNSEYTDHSVASSKDWQATQGGKGDVLEAVSAACTKYDMDMGIYLSPWDANAESYGYGTGHDDATDSNGDYNEYYMNQLTEILGNDKYGNNGKFVEVWMDGAKGSGAAAQKYEFDKWFDLIEELEPGCLVFSPYATTVRWIGNEAGKAGDPVWSKVNKQKLRDDYNRGYEDAKYLNSGDANGDIWSVGECDVSLTSGWFWHAGNGPKSMEQLTDIYFKSVGRGQPLLLNVAPDNRGKFTNEDVARLEEFSSAINNTFDENLADSSTTTATASAVRGNSNKYAASNVLDDDKDTYWTMDDGQTTGSITIDLGEEKTFDVVQIEEYIKLGQRISEFSVDVFANGSWKKFGEGYTVGAKRLVRGTPVSASQIRINIEESMAVPLIENVDVYKADDAFEIQPIAPVGTEFVNNLDFANKNAWNHENIGVDNSSMWSSTTGNYTSFTFTGTKAWVVGTVDPNHGIMEVWIDDEKVADADTYRSSRAVSQILYSTPDLEYGEHTVKLVVKGQKNAASRGNAIGLEGAYYLNNNGAGMFEIENKNYTVNESESVDITIKRVGGTTGPASVHFATSPDSAVHGRHYKDVNETIEFADGQETATVTVSTIDNEEKTGDLDFIINIDTPSNDSIIGFNKKATVTIKDNEQDLPYTEKNPFVFPGSLEETKVLEGELFTLLPITGDKYVRIAEDTQASNGKKVSWFEPGNIIKVPFNAPKAGTYTLKMRYQSGRSESNPNRINWSGTNVVPGGMTVRGTGAQDPPPYQEVSFDIVINEAGAGELVFTADSSASPNIDKFEVTPKELEVVNHTITATAGENGTITPSGTITIEEGASQEFTFTPNEGYVVEDVLVDGVSVGARDSYTLDNVTKNTTINVTFKAIDVDVPHGENNPLILTGEEVTVEAESLEIDGVGGEIENKTGASDGKIVGWLGKTSRGNAWLNMWVNSDVAATYDVEIRYFTGANNTLYYANNDGSVSGSIECPTSMPDFATKTIRVSLNAGLDKIKFYNDTASTANIDTIKVTRVSVAVDKSELTEYLTSVENVVAEDYTAESYEVFKAAKEAAEAIVAKENATQEEVNEALNNLIAAFEGLVENEVVPEDVFKKHLETAVEMAEEITDQELSNVVEAVVTEFRAALAEAKALLNDETATQAQIDASFKRLSDVMHMLSFQKGDKKALIALVDKIGTLNGDEYIKESWNKLQVVLEKANGVINDNNAMVEEVAQTYEELLRSYLDLRLKPNKDKLNDLINKADSLDKAEYTAESWAVLEANVSMAKAIFADENASEEEVKNAEKALEFAMNSLVSNSSSNGNGNGNNNNNNNSNGNTNNGGTTGTGDGKLPQTGGTSAVALGLLGLTAAGAGVTLRRKKK